MFLAPQARSATMGRNRYQPNPAFIPMTEEIGDAPKATKRTQDPRMSLDTAPTTLDHVSSSLAGVVAVDGGTVGLDVQFGAFLAVILGLSIPVVVLITLFIQSEAQGTATSFRQPDSIGGQRFEDE